jgi:tetratricopeptide (TPR) repeat protein
VILNKPALKIFNLAINSYMKIPYHHDTKIKTKILYNKAKTLTRMNKLEESTETCKQAVKWCVSQNSLYGLGNLYYHIGYNFSLLLNPDIAIEYYNKSIQIFMIQENKVFVKHIKEKIDELSILID